MLPFAEVELFNDVVEDTLEVLPFYDVELDDVITSPEVRRESPKNAGVYVVGQVEDQDIIFTVDTGAGTTVLSEKIWEQLSDEVKNRKRKQMKRPLIGPNGKVISSQGKALVKLKLGPVVLDRYVAVADIIDECLLGADIILGLKEGQMDLLLSESKLKWNEMSIPCFNVGDGTERKVLCVEERIVPSYSELIIDVKLENPVVENRELLIEPYSEFVRRSQVATASVQLM